MLGKSLKLGYRDLRLFWLILLSSVALRGDYINIHPAVLGPWFTGTLLTESAFTIPNGHYNVEPYLLVDNSFGLFNKHWQKKRFLETLSNINLELWLQTGLTNFMDFTIAPSFFYNYAGDEESSWRFGDLYTELGFQLCRQLSNKGFTAKLALGELFPTGVYQRLNPEKLGTDFSGGGTYATAFKFVISRHWNVYTLHYLAARMSLTSILSSRVAVHGLSVYGGDKTTKGHVFPGTSFPLLLGFEYNMTQNWVLALDIANVLTLKTKFRGETILPVGWGSAYSLSFAPAIEYNYSANVGLIAGVWLSALGKNSLNFINYVVALNWYI